MTVYDALTHTEALALHAAKTRLSSNHSYPTGDAYYADIDLVRRLTAKIEAAR